MAENPLTEAGVRRLWQQGRSDEYGIDAHRLNITSIESFGKQQSTKVRELDLSFNMLSGPLPRLVPFNHTAKGAHRLQKLGEACAVLSIFLPILVWSC
jgi:hypothetical protein